MASAAPAPASTRAGAVAGTTEGTSMRPPPRRDNDRFPGDARRAVHVPPVDGDDPVRRTGNPGADRPRVGVDDARTHHLAGRGRERRHPRGAVDCAPPLVRVDQNDLIDVGLPGVWLVRLL